MPSFAESGRRSGSRKSNSSVGLGLDFLPIDLYPRIGDERWSDRSLIQATWAFLAFGILLRMIRFALMHPFWSDESFVVANLLKRGYLGLLSPLDYQQVCPIAFLWIELTAIKMLGFSEASLRVFPTLCAIGSLVVFHHLASRLMKGLPLLFAVAIVAVAINPIRHSGEVKPYASDFLVSTCLIIGMVEWKRRTHRSNWLWVLAAASPVAPCLSFPSIFVLVAISIGIFREVRRVARPPVTVAYLGFNAAILCGILILAGLHAVGHSEETKAYMVHYWSAQFLPISKPLELPSWLFRSFTGHLFAYPVGGANGASLLTVACLLAGSRELIRRDRRILVVTFAASLGLPLVASAFRLYPFGESERLMQFEGPMICLLAGFGLACSLGRLRRPHSYQRAVIAFVLLFASIGLGTIVADFRQPAKTVEDLRARDFAKWFWAEVGRDSELACVQTDLGLDLEGGPTHYGRSADYFCFQKLYSSRHREGRPLDWAGVSASHPLRCVLYDGVPYDSTLFVRWMGLMSRDYELKRTETYCVNAGVAHNGHPREDHLTVLEFVPRIRPVDPIELARDAIRIEARRERGILQLSGPNPDLLPLQR